jgi:hypothetical protein
MGDSVLLLRGQELQLETQHRVGRDAGDVLVSVAQLRADSQSADAPDLHSHHALFQASDHLPLPDAE